MDVLLKRPFFDQPTLTVAQELLGANLGIHGPFGLRQGIIVETEAYVGPKDRASHASRGQTARTKPMFGPPGFTYVYLVYGMYYCLNLVTEAEGYPAAVLIRALAPVDEIGDPRIAAGPGKVCRWLKITKTHNQIDATGPILYIEKGLEVPSGQIVARPRIGVNHAGPWAKKPWRFYLKDHPSVSKP